MSAELPTREQKKFPASQEWVKSKGKRNRLPSLPERLSEKLKQEEAPECIKAICEKYGIDQLNVYCDEQGIVFFARPWDMTKGSEIASDLNNFLNLKEFSCGVTLLSSKIGSFVLYKKGATYTPKEVVEFLIPQPKPPTCTL